MNTQFTAKTRSGATAYFSRVHPEFVVENEYGYDPFVLLGYIREDEPELWTVRGCWCADASKHHNDLMLQN